MSGVSVGVSTTGVLFGVQFDFNLVFDFGARSNEAFIQQASAR
jgi:hypothetical protein